MVEGVAGNAFFSHHASPCLGVLCNWKAEMSYPAKFHEQPGGAMSNMRELLDRLEAGALISLHVKRFLQGFLEKRLCLTFDIIEEEIEPAVERFAQIRFGSGLGLNADFLTGRFKAMAAPLLAESALLCATDHSITSLDISRIFAAYIIIHDGIHGIGPGT